MANLKETLEKDDDSEESLISQFETTLTIKPSSNELSEVADISIDHTTFVHNHSIASYLRDQSIADIVEDEDEADRVGVLEDKAGAYRPRLGQRTIGPTLDRNLAIKIAQDGEKSDLLVQDKYDRILAPSPLIDYSLLRFTKVFTEFLNSNPHIQKESPRFAKDCHKTLVILSPYSAEHAFGRKWVSKSYLATIFERPQRLLASCIGISAAVTMFPFFYKIVNSTKRGVISAPHVRKVHGKTWPKKLFELCLDSHKKLQEGEIEVPEDWNSGDIYLTPKTINAIEGVVGTIESAVDSLFKDKHDSHNLAFVVVRPPGHHCHASLPSGFCLINNVHIAIEYAHDSYGITHCAILDVDLHHGDGSQDICWQRAGFLGDEVKEEDEEDEDEDEHSVSRDDYGKRPATYPKVGYFSMHDIKSYPTELGYATKEHIKNASTCIMDHDLNIWNVHLQNWSTEEEFYKHYQTKYVNILNRANQFLNQSKKQYDVDYQEYLADLSKYNRYLFKPHLYSVPVPKPSPPPPFKPLIIISAGFDALEYENPQMQRHGINVPTSFYANFTKDAVKLAKIHSNGKIISFLEGGYSDGALSTGIFSHLIGLTNELNDTSTLEATLLWNPTWGSEMVVKELVKGCKRNWTPYKKPQTDVTIWANEVIKLGRSMMPNAILPASYIYSYDEKLAPQPQQPMQNLDDPKPISKMAKEILDNSDEEDFLPVPDSPLKSDPEDARRLLRHTRSYYKKLAEAQKGKDKVSDIHQREPSKLKFSH